MRVLFAAAVVAAMLVPTVGAQSTSDPPLQRLDYVRCMSHVERASQAAMFKQPTRADVAKALECNARNTTELTQPQLEALAEVYSLLKIQLEAPSATVGMEIVQAVQRFLRMIE